MCFAVSVTQKAMVFLERASTIQVGFKWENSKLTPKSPPPPPAAEQNDIGLEPSAVMLDEESSVLPTNIM